MRVLLLHPEDSPRYGPWIREKWDLIVDLGKSSELTAAGWQKLVGAPVVRLDSFRRSVDDPRCAGDILRAGFGQLIDGCGLDWWELTSLFVHAELETALALGRLAANCHCGDELFSTRPDWPVSAFAMLLGRNVRSFSGSASVVERVRRYARAYNKLNTSQILEILLDKYDAGYEWRSRVSARPRRISESVVLLPSAYTNVSRTAVAYASLLPDQKFLLVGTRQSGLRFDRRSNVEVTRLARYAKAGKCRSEKAQISSRWVTLRARLQEIPEIDLLSRTGMLNPFEGWFRSGVAVRDAWRSVLDREPVTAVLCGDDSNWYTRLPVILARMRNLPTVDFHHGALDGRFLLKELSSDFYLSKNQMERDYLTRVCGLPPERVVVGGLGVAPALPTTAERRRSNIVFFSEPYETLGGRPQEVYRELLPVLGRLARDHARNLVLKLHPFENPGERSRIVDATLGNHRNIEVKIVSGPLTQDLLASAWFGITVESSTVVDCSRNGVPCFQCEWLVSTPFEYVQQFARFGVGRLLHSPCELAEIPRMLAEWEDSPAQYPADHSPLATETLRQLLSGHAVPVSK